MAAERPTLDPEVVADDAALADVISQLHVDDPHLFPIVEQIAWLHTDLVGLISPEAWQLVLRVDEHERTLLTLAIRWAFEEGRRHPVGAAGSGGAP